MNRITADERRLSTIAWIGRLLLVVIALVVLSAGTRAQNQRGAWMWNHSGHPFGAVNVVGNVAKENELIVHFGSWDFDRIYTSMGTMPLDDPESVARWNASLDDAGIDSQILYGILTPNPSSLASLIQNRLIDFNTSRADPRERFDAVHLDIEPHASSAWQNGTLADRRNLLSDLLDTYIAARAQLDNNGAADVKIYADLPVWLDSTSAIGWLHGNDRNQWFDDIAVPLDGITLMAFERSTLGHITGGVQYEVNNFNAEVRIGLNANEVGPGNTFDDFDALIGMAEALELHYGTDITGIDFQPLVDFTDLAPMAAASDFDTDGDVDGDDFLIWQTAFGSGAAASSPGSEPVPEPTGLTIVALAGLFGLSLVCVYRLSRQ